MLISNEDKFYTGSVFSSGGKIYRYVKSFEDSKKVLNILKEQGLLGTKIVDTKVFSDEKKLLEHNVISPIIYSGEFTESMAFDCMQNALTLGEKILKNNLYAWDFVPNNFTFYNGDWILYDFEGIDVNSNRFINQARCMFKIFFSSCELTKILKRAELKEYYLNRIKQTNLFKMIPFKNWFLYLIKIELCMLLCKLKQYKLMYFMLNKTLASYSKNFIKKYYIYICTSEEESLFEEIQNMLKTEWGGVKNIFCIGKQAQEYAVYDPDTNINKFVYTDDYEECDKFYNYIYKNGLKHINTAAIYPLLKDEVIPQNYKYRTLYDDFAKERLCRECVINFNYDEIAENNNNEEELLNNISDFTTDKLVLITEKDVIENIKNILVNIFSNVEIHNVNNKKIIFAYNKFNNKKYESKEIYSNSNRGSDADKQSQKILEIIKKHKN